MPTLPPETLTALAALSLALSAALAAAVAVLAARLRAIRATYARLLDGGPAREDLLTAVDRQVATTERCRAATELTSREVAALRQRVSSLVRAPAVVRYDAFGDAAGELSFSTALLDEAGDGIVLSGINSRTDTRVYAKAVHGGGSPHNLSAEERTAVGEVMAGGPAVPGATAAR